MRRPFFAATLVLAAFACKPAEYAGTPLDAGKPTAEEAATFLAKVDKDLHRLYAAVGHANWTYENFIQQDTEAMAAAADEAQAEYLTRTIKEAARFDPILPTLPPDQQRQLLLLKLQQTIPSPSDPSERSELSAIKTRMDGAYGEGQYCLPSGSKLTGLAHSANAEGKQCMKLDDLENVLAKDRDPDQLLEAWAGWHATARPARAKYPRYVELANKGAKEIGFADTGAMWRSGYDMSAEDFEKDVDRLWSEVKPLYDELHCYVRSKLQAKYGKDKVPAHAPIPSHLLGNMWAQQWGDIFDLVMPYGDAASLDVTKKLTDQKYDAQKMVKLGEKFFLSLGFDPLPDTFWKRSLFTRPQDRNVVCHASAWDVTYGGDLRIKMCIQVNESDLLVIHHELGHDFYYQRYFKLPVLFQAGANDGFHEGIGDTLALSVTPDYLKKVGLLDEVPKTDHGRINQQMKMALDKIAFLPFGYLIDKWRWDVFAGKTPKEKYNEAWWALKTKYQGVSRPLPGSEEDFDPAAKYHVSSGTPYIRYFLSFIYQFQFYRALCKAAGHTGPIDTCSFYGNPDAGKKLIAMLSMGASRPWQEALSALSGETKADATAILDYFAPLRAWLKTQIAGEQCGW